MHVKKASVGIWNIVKYSALCVAFLTCIFTPIAQTYAAEVKTVEFGYQETSLRVDGEDGFQQYYQPAESGIISTGLLPTSQYYTVMSFYSSVQNLNAVYGVHRVEDLYISLNFDVTFDYSAIVNGTYILNYLEGFQLRVNGNVIPVTLVDSTFSEAGGSYYARFGFVFRVDSPSDLVNILNGSNDTFGFAIAFERTFYNIAYDCPLIEYGGILCNFVLKYTPADQYNASVPISPGDQAILDGMNQKGDELEESGKEISDAVDQLESLNPDVGDPFENAPDYQVYATGSQFFIQLFDYLYANQMTGAFISFALIMALVVFIMRR